MKNRAEKVRAIPRDESLVEYTVFFVHVQPAFIEVVHHASGEALPAISYSLRWKEQPVSKQFVPNSRCLQKVELELAEPFPGAKLEARGVGGVARWILAAALEKFRVESLPE